MEPQFFDLGMTPYDRPVERDLHIANTGGCIMFVCAPASTEVPHQCMTVLPLLAVSVPRKASLQFTVLSTRVPFCKTRQGAV